MAEGGHRSSRSVRDETRRVKGGPISGETSLAAHQRGLFRIPRLGQAILRPGL